MLNEDKLKKFVYWINERESIRLSKTIGRPAPWTEDQFLQQYRFCNVHRVDDRVSQWLLKNVYEPYRAHELLWFMAACARWVNWPPAIQELMDQGAWPTMWFDADRFGAVIDERVARGDKAWTGAYMIHSLSHPDIGKGTWIAAKALQPLYDRRIEFSHFFKQERRTVEAGVGKIAGSFNHGTFMAGQIVADWTYTKLMQSAPDLYTWAPIGPGSKRGMNRLHDRALEGSLSQEQFTDELQELMSLVVDMTKIGISMTAHDFQNCLCEFDKYLRLEQGGQVRSKYQPETRF